MLTWPKKQKYSEAFHMLILSHSRNNKLTVCYYVFKSSVYYRVKVLSWSIYVWKQILSFLRQHNRYEFFENSVDLICISYKNTLWSMRIIITFITIIIIKVGTTSDSSKSFAKNAVKNHLFGLARGRRFFDQPCRNRCKSVAGILHKILDILQYIEVLNTCISFVGEVSAKFRSLSTLRFISDLLLWILLPPTRLVYGSLCQPEDFLSVIRFL